MNYNEISKETFSFLKQSYDSLKDSPLDQSIIKLVLLRASQINACSYCCKIHTNEAREHGIPQEKLDILVAWHMANLFSEKERAALQWCEDLTKLNADYPKTRELLSKFFSEREIVDLTAAISIMNTYNRVAIGIKS